MKFMLQSSTKDENTSDTIFYTKHIDGHIM